MLAKTLRISTTASVQSLVRAFSNASVSVPSNLQLADVSILEPKPRQLDPSEMVMPEYLNVVTFHPERPHETVQPIALSKTMREVGIRKDIMLDLVRYLRHQRRQPKKTKTMAEIAGSNKKPWPQKGQGRTQVGNRRNSAWVGGFVSHGPVIRDYSIGMNRKTRALGGLMSLKAKILEGNLIVFDELRCADHKTSHLMSQLAHHKLDKEKIMFIDEDTDANFAQASRNVKNVTLIPSRYFDVIKVLKVDKVAFSRESFLAIQQRLLDQYTHAGKRKALLASLDSYESVIAAERAAQQSEGKL